MDGRLQKAKRYLDARRGERVTLEELASAVGASPFHLQRRFKAAFGVSPRGYQDAYRVESVNQGELYPGVPKIPTVTMAIDNSHADYLPQFQSRVPVAA